MSRFSKYTDLVKYILIAIAVIVCGTIYIVSSQKEADKESSEALYEAELVMTADGNVSEGTANDTLNGAEGSMDMTTAVTEEDSNIYIYICGYVVKPGVYTVKQNTRVYELIELAGGFSEEADDTALNLVDIVSDGQKLYVPAKGESVTAVGEELQTENALVI